MQEKYDEEFVLKKAEEIATRAHEQQYRKGTDALYIKHPEDVVRRLGGKWDLAVVAWLHDVLEQSDETKDSLIQQGIPEYLVNEVVLLTHDKNIPYADYIDGISTSKIATQVKIADILSNLSDLPSIKQIRRYSEALLKLTRTYVEEKELQSGKKSVEELAEEIKAGLLSHAKDPFGWLTSFIDDADTENLRAIIADKDQVPEHLRKLERPPVVLIVDCGTGETKLLLYSINGDIIDLKEIFKLNAVSRYIDKSDDFINTIRHYLSKYEADIVLIAASAWLREASGETLDKGNSLLIQLLDSGMLCKILEPREEAWLELAAAEYVSDKLNLKIDGTYSSGAGSTQFTKHFDTVFTYKIGNEVGRVLINENGLVGAEKWKDHVKNMFSGSDLQLNGLILCFSAVCHAAAICGLQLNTELTYVEVTSRFRAYVKEQSEKVKLSSLDIRNLSNAIQHLYTIENVVSEKSKMIFIRDIVISEQNLRITWSLGWYLELLDRLQSLKFTNKTLNRFRKEQSKFDEIGQEIGQDLRGSMVTKTAAGHVLLDINQTANIILNKANAIEKQVTPQLQFSASYNNAKLEGLEFRLKTQASLVRKLKSRLKKLISTNASLQFYIPRLTDVYNEVDDVLRYTVIADTRHYTRTTISLLENLKEKLGCEYKCFSFWDEESTYFGLNAFVTISNFTFEIQFHTNESWRVKQSESHDLYEGYRILPNSYAKFILYTSMKKIWNTVPIPPDVDTIVRPTPFTDPLMEQWGIISVMCELIKKYPLDSNILNEFILTHDLKNNACFRLIRGRIDDEFKYLAYPPNLKRLAWVSGGENLQEFLKFDTSRFAESISDFTGKSLSWVNDKLQDGYGWKLIILPKKYCIPADWDGVFKSIQQFYPDAASIVLRFKKELMSLSFSEIEQEIYPPSSYREIKDNPLNNAQYIDEKKIIELESPLLWQVRGFLYNVIGLNENFKGDGYVYNDSLKKMHTEYLIPNQEIKDFFGAQIIELHSFEQIKPE